MVSLMKARISALSITQAETAAPPPEASTISVLSISPIFLIRSMTQFGTPSAGML
jgi:hypothetical protein